MYLRNTTAEGYMESGPHTVTITLVHYGHRMATAPKTTINNTFFY